MHERQVGISLCLATFLVLSFREGFRWRANTRVLTIILGTIQAFFVGYGDETFWYLCMIFLPCSMTQCALDIALPIKHYYRDPVSVFVTLPSSCIGYLSARVGLWLALHKTSWHNPSYSLKVEQLVECIDTRISRNWINVSCCH